VDPGGNVYAVGLFSGAVDFGGGPFEADWDGFLFKLDASGNHVWSKHGKDARLNDVAATPAGEVIAVGSFGEKTNLTLEGIEQGKRGRFVAKCGADGKAVWSDVSVAIGKGGGIAYEEVAVGADGSFAVLATFDKTVSIGGKELTSAGGDDILVLKYDPTGKLAWLKPFGGKSREWATGIAVDPAGNFVFTGSFVKPIDFGGGELVSKGADDVFVAKLNASGDHVWSQRYGGPQSDYISDVAVAPSAEVAVTGNYAEGIDFGSEKHTCRGSRDGFVLELDAGGKPLWSKRIGGSESDYAYGVAMDEHGAVVVTGNFLLSTTYTGGDMIKGNGGYDIYLFTFPR
jgi:hypothetical protein